MLREFLTRELFGPAAELLGSEDGSFRATSSARRSSGW
jgi:hypothetical protein